MRPCGPLTLAWSWSFESVSPPSLRRRPWRPIVRRRPRAQTLLRTLEMSSSREDIQQPHGAVARRVFAIARARRSAVDYAQYLSDRIGPRLAGSTGEKEAVAWAVHEIRSLGLNVR